MNKVIAAIQNYLIFAFPLVLICMAWSSLDSTAGESSSFVLQALWEVLSWNLMLWFLVLIVFLSMLILIPHVREKTLKRLANIKDKDEREEFITGKAARASYISTLSLLILLLFFSIFNLNIHRVPESQAINGKTGSLSIGLNFDLFDSKAKSLSPPNSEVLFESKDIPLSKSALLLLVLVWQVSTFRIVSQKEL